MLSRSDVLKIILSGFPSRYSDGVIHDYTFKSKPDKGQKRAVKRKPTGALKIKRQSKKAKRV